MSKEKDHDAPEAELRRGGKLTRAGMVAVIAAGGAVSHNGTIYAKEADLPDEAELLAGDKEAAEAAVAGLDAQIAALGSQRAAIEKAGQAPAAEPTKSGGAKAGVHAPSR